MGAQSLIITSLLKICDKEEAQESFMFKLLKHMKRIFLKKNPLVILSSTEWPGRCIAENLNLRCP